MGTYDPTSVKFRPELKAELQAVADSMPGDDRGNLGAVIKKACMEHLIMLRVRRIPYADIRRILPITSVLQGATKYFQVIPIDSPENVGTESARYGDPRISL